MANDPRGRSRKRRSKPSRSVVEQLETRQLLTFSATLAGSTSTFTVGNATDSVIFSQDGAGNLQHNTLTAPPGEGFVDNLDFNSTNGATSDHLAAATGSTVNVQGPSFIAAIGSPSVPASTLLANFIASGNPLSATVVDDSASSTPNTYTATSTSVTGTGINVGLIGPAFGAGVTLRTGSAANTINVLSNSSNLTINNPAGTDAVNVGNAGSLAGLTQPLTITDQGASTAVKVDDSADPSNTSATLIATGVRTASLGNLGPAVINLSTVAGNTLAILGGTGTDTQTVDFSAGNPIASGLTYTGGAGANTLILQGTQPGGPFATEVYNATGAGAGTITLDGSTITFTGLKPVIDTTPATNFTFNYTGGLDARINVGAGAAVNGTPTTLISTASATSQFEQESYANKANVTINAGAGNDVVSVTGSALAAGSNTVIDGQGGTNTLNYDAGGSTVIIAPTGTPGQATITRAGSGSLLVMNFQQINVVNGQIQGVPVTSPTFVASPPLKGTAGVPLNNVIVATFTPASPTATAADFGASINWGDGTTTVGTVVPDASNPTLFDVVGSHTYATSSPAGGFPIGVTVSERETNTSIIPGVTLTQSSSASTTSSATISDAALTATGATLSAVAGQPLTQALVADFTYGGGPAPTTNFSGTINWGDGTSSTFNSTNISTVGTSSAGTTYLVRADHTFPTFGTFPVAVTINSAGGSSAVALGSAIVSDSLITTPVTPAAITATEGVPFTGTVATFTDPNASASAANFLALITWGDGHVTQGTVAATAGTPGSFAVTGTNTYAKAGSYSAVVSIRDTATTGGSTATVAVPVNVLGAAIAQGPGAIVNTEIVRQPFTDVVGTFTSANPFASASDFAATINWDDGSPPTTGIIGQGADGTFSVTGSHTYALPRPITGPYHYSVTVKELASTSTATLSGGESVVLDALLTAQGATIPAVEGKATVGPLIASFSYAGATPMVTSNFSGTVDWGDGTTSPLLRANITQVFGTEAVTNYLVNADHTFPTQGTFPVTVTVDSGFGSVAVAHSTAIVSDALAVAVLPPAPVENLAFNNLAVATFTDAGTPDPVSKYSATINWGDGSAIVPGTIVANANGTFNVLSSHKYALPGSFPLTVTVSNDLSGETSGTANVTVTPAPVNLSGQLNPASDSGESSTDAITNVNRPNFFGSATPGTIITLFAIPAGSTTSIPIGSTVADGSGAWSITSTTLADGRYTIQAIGTDPAGITSALDVILPNPLQGPLVVDTVAPKVTSVQFQPLNGDVLVSFQDDPSGLDQSRVLDGANYSFVRVASLPNQAKLKSGVGLPLPSSFVVTGVSTTAPSDPAARQDVVVSLNDGSPIRGGYYRLTILSGGIEDVAGNALDGEFYGYFPSGNNRPGGNFVADLNSIHNTVFAPLPVGSSVSPLNPPGTLATATFIPTVKAVVVRDGKQSVVLAGGRNDAPVPLAGRKLPGRLKLKESKTILILGKPTPHAKVVAKPHAKAHKEIKPLAPAHEAAQPHAPVHKATKPHHG